MKQINLSSKKNLVLIVSVFVICMYVFWYFLGKPVELKATYHFNEKLQSVSYAPFKYGESPADLNNGLKIPEERIDKDLELLSKKFKGIRIYSVTGLESIPKYARKHGLKVLLGAWVCGDEKVTQKELRTVVRLAREYPDVVEAVVVGNEVLLRREMSGQKLGGYISWVKEQLPDTKVTYADVWEFWLQNKHLAQSVDFVTIHILPYWEDYPISVENSLEHIKHTHNEVASILKDKKLLIGETGWPSEGRMREASLPSPISQAEFIRGFLSIANEHGWNYNIIEAFDQSWKRASEGAVGGYWGIYDESSNDKNIIDGDISEFPNYGQLFIVSLVLFMISLVFIDKGQNKENNSIVKALLFAFVSAIVLSLQLNQYLITSKDFIDYFRSLVSFVGMIVLYIYVLNIYLNFTQNNTVVKSFDTARLFMVAFVFIEAFAICVDGRYKSFANYGLFFLLIVFAILYFKQISSTFSTDLFEKFVSVLVAVCSVGILYNETLANIQAVAFSLITFFIALLIYKQSKKANLKVMLPYVIFSLIAVSVIYIFRQNVFLNTEYILLCENDPKLSVCIIKNTVGYIVHHKILELTALILGIILLFLRHKIFAYVVLFVSLFAILFFNSNAGAIVLVIVLFIISKLENDKMFASEIKN
ncbi:MAG: beta (1-6) glucans synthase [Campylobacterota bacterium]